MQNINGQSLYLKIAKVIAEVKEEYPDGIPSVDVEKRVDNMLAGLLNNEPKQESVSTDSHEFGDLRLRDTNPPVFFIKITSLDVDGNVRHVLHFNGYRWNGGASLIEKVGHYAEGQKMYYGVYSKDKVVTYTSGETISSTIPVIDYDTFINDFTIFEVSDGEGPIENLVQEPEQTTWHGFSKDEEVIANIGRPVPAKFIRPIDDDFALVKYGSTSMRISYNNISKYEEEIPGITDETQEDNTNNVENIQETGPTYILPRYLNLGNTIYNPTYGTGRVDLNVVSPNPYFTASFDNCDVSVTFDGMGKVDRSSMVRPSIWPDEELFIKYPTDAMKAWDEYIKSKRWRAIGNGGLYYTIDSNDWSVIAEYDNQLKADDRRWTSGNYFENRKDAEKAARRIQNMLNEIHMKLTDKFNS